jgi:preprotein translocase subunit SecB
MSESNNYRVNSVVLLESNFFREMIIDFNNEEHKHNVDIEIEPQHTEDSGLLHIKLKLTYDYGTETQKFVEAKIVFIGSFQVPEKPTVSVETFESMNGPAIIYPFIREHLATMSLKAIIPPILLPSHNFSKIQKP